VTNRNDSPAQQARRGPACLAWGHSHMCQEARLTSFLSHVQPQQAEERLLLPAAADVDGKTPLKCCARTEGHR